jgi:hypothetical protein
MMSDVDDVRLAAELVGWLDRERAGLNVRGLAAAGFDVPTDMADEVWSVWPDSRRFGKPALAAFTAKVLPTGCCRFGLMRMWSVRANVPTPPPTRALRTLLGEPCPSCVDRMRAELSARVSAGTSPAVRARVNRLAVQASARRNGHPTGTCKVCHEYRRGVRGALTAGASGELPELLPHKAKLAPTGRVDPPKPPPHNGVGARANCECDECRGSRVAIYQASIRSRPERRRMPTDPSDRAHARAARR